jgi:hypothetical protein
VARSSPVRSTMYFFISGQPPVAVDRTLQVQRSAINSTVAKN